MKYPKISVLVAAYKSENVIRDAMNHFINEVKYPNLEVIVGVDTREDKTIDIVREFAKKSKRIIVDFSEERRGIVKAMNSMLRKSKGNIIIKFDAEFRFINPSKCLYKVIKYYEDPNIGALTFYGKLPPRFYEKILVSRLVKAQDFMSQIVQDWRKDKYPVIKGNFDMPLSVHCFRGGIFKKIDTESINDDAEFAYSVLDKGYEILFTKDILFYSLVEPANLLNVFYRQRRCRVGWLKIAKKRKINFKKYYASLFLFLLFNFYKYKIYDLVSLFYFIFAYTIALIGAFFKVNEKITKIWVKK